MPLQLPFDYETQQASLKRRQGIVDALTQRFLTPQQGGTISNSAGTFYSGPSALESALTPILGMMATEKAQNELNADQAGLTQRYNEGLKSSLEEYEGLRNGKPAGMVPSGAPTIDNDPANPKMVPDPANPGVAPDPRKAAIHAIVSSYAPMRDIGMSDLKESAKNALTAKDLLPYADPSSVPAIAARGVMGFRPKSDLGEVNGIVYDKNNRQIVQLGGPEPTRVKQDGDLYEQSPSTGAYRKLDNAPKINVTTNVASGENEFLKKLGASTAELVDNSRKAAQQAQKSEVLASRLEALDKQGVFTGPTANAAVAVGQFANALGVPVDKAKLGRSEEYTSTLGRQVAEVLTAGAGVGRSMTDEDRKAFMTQFPSLINTPEGRQRVIAMLRDAARQDKGYAASVEQNLDKEFPEAGRLFRVAPSRQPFPEPNVSPAGAPMSLDDYIKSRQKPGGR